MRFLLVCQWNFAYSVRKIIPQTVYHNVKNIPWRPLRELKADILQRLDLKGADKMIKRLPGIPVCIPCSDAYSKELQNDTAALLKYMYFD